MLIRNHWIGCVFCFFIVSAHAQLLCPPTNQSTKNWECHDATIKAACNGKVGFIGVVYRADEGYLCMYQTSIPNGAFMVPKEKPPHPDTIGELLQKWQKGKGQVHYHCVAVKPVDCPILTKHDA